MTHGQAEHGFALKNVSKQFDYVLATYKVVF